MRVMFAIVAVLLFAGLTQYAGSFGEWRPIVKFVRGMLGVVVFWCLFAVMFLCAVWGFTGCFPWESTCR